MSNPLKSNLIVVDGLPGSGKTTIAIWLSEQLRKDGISMTHIPEYDTKHPLWWYEHWDGNQYSAPDFDNVPMETHIKASLGKWRTFAKLVKNTKQYFIVESAFFQNAVAMFMMGGATLPCLIDYAHDVQEVVQSLHPILIYLRQKDISSALHRICKIRGPVFQQELLDNMESFPYLQERNLKGLPGVTTLWEEIQGLTDQLFVEYKIRKLMVEPFQGDWLNYWGKIIDLLKDKTIH